MKTKNEMVFAEGWTQEIRSGDGEREDLMSYISDTTKSLWGFRPRWGSEWIKNATLEDLRQEADDLQKEVKREIELARKEGARQAADQAAHHLAYAEAMKPKPVNNRPFANLNVLLAEQTSYYNF